MLRNELNKKYHMYVEKWIKENLLYVCWEMNYRKSIIVSKWYWREMREKDSFKNNQIDEGLEKWQYRCLLGAKFIVEVARNNIKYEIIWKWWNKKLGDI